MQVQGALEDLDVQFETEEGVMMTYWLAVGNIVGDGVKAPVVLDHHWLTQILGAVPTVPSASARGRVLIKEVTVRQRGESVTCKHPL